MFNLRASSPYFTKLIIGLAYKQTQFVKIDFAMTARYRLLASIWFLMQIEVVLMDMQIRTPWIFFC